MAEATGTGDGGTGTGTTGTGTTGTGTTGTGTTGTGTTAPAAHWSGLTDAVETAYIDNKGWKSPADVYKSYRGVETLVGRDPSTLMVTPRADDPAGFRAVMQKLGLPETADKYDFGKPADGDLAFDDAYLGWAKQTFHKVGVPAAMAKAIVAENQAYMKALSTQQADDYKVALQADKTALLREWGGGHERMMQAAKTAANSLGFDQDMIDVMEEKIGYAKTMKFFANIATKMGEDTFVAANGTMRLGDSLTPAEAKAQYDAMVLDPNAQKALTDKTHPSHKAAKEKQTNLFKIMYPG